MTPTARVIASRAAVATWIVMCAWAAGSRAQDAVQLADTPPAAPVKLPKCVHVRGEARYSGFGYDHIVEVHNACDKQANCRVATDVNPQAQTMTLNPGEKQSVTTFRGSPASAFTPDVSCKLAP